MRIALRDELEQKFGPGVQGMPFHLPLHTS